MKPENSLNRIVRKEVDAETLITIIYIKIPNNPYGAISDKYLIRFIFFLAYQLCNKHTDISAKVVAIAAPIAPNLGINRIFNITFTMAPQTTERQ